MEDSGALVIMTYWEGDPEHSEAFLNAWRPIDFDVRSFGPEDIMSALSEIDVRWATLFDAIRIPACRSDLARLALVYRHGGLYVDAHTLPHDGAAIRTLPWLLAYHELVIFVGAESLAERELEVINSVLLSRRGSDLIMELLADAFETLELHLSVETQTQRHVAYDIVSMTGGWLYAVALLELAYPYEPLKPLRGRVHVRRVNTRDADPGFWWYRNYNYRKPGDHWSERQITERLFRCPSEIPLSSIEMRGGSAEDDRGLNYRQARDARIIRASGSFDSEYYLATYRDVAAANVDPLIHFILHGAAEGRNPNAGFVTGDFARAHDVPLGRNPFAEYIVRARVAGGSGRSPTLKSR